jgi:hypothetical protein
MSKRSGLSRLEDLKRGFIDIGRYRHIYHKIDMETWRDKTCPICGQGFTEEPRTSFMSHSMHNGCSWGPEFDKWFAKWYEAEYQGDSWEERQAFESMDEEKECGS